MLKKPMFTGPRLALPIYRTLHCAWPHPVHDTIRFSVRQVFKLVDALVRASTKKRQMRRLQNHRVARDTTCGSTCGSTHVAESSALKACHPFRSLGNPLSPRAAAQRAAGVACTWTASAYKILTILTEARGNIRWRGNVTKQRPIPELHSLVSMPYMDRTPT